jgi:putative serine protease PepD
VSGRIGAAVLGAVACAGLLAGCGGSSHAASSADKLSATQRTAESCAPVPDPGVPALPSLVRVTTPPDASGAYSVGTGIIIDAGWVLTNQHVIALAQGQPVTTLYDGGARTSGRVVASDANLDLALIAADTGQNPSVAWGDEGKLQQGDLLYAVGFAFGSDAPLEFAGHFVGTEVDGQTGQAYIRSDVQLQHGDSGGPMLNRCGQVVGINTAREPGVDQGVYTGLSIPAFKARDWAIKQRQSLAQ